MPSFFKKESTAFAIIAFLVFSLQAYKVGFEPGHHGWVSAHGLSIISRADLENKFVGYTSRFLENNQEEFYYFDRYPILFSAAMNTLLKPFEADLDVYVYLARQLMNAIFLLTMWLSYRFLKTMLGSHSWALTTCLFLFGTQFFVHFKSMVHFDQPAILGSVLLMYGIARSKKHGDHRLLALAVVLAPLLGRGYANCFILLVWFLVELWSNLKGGFKFKKVFGPSFWSLGIGGILAGAALFYNISIEAHKRDISYSNTSIVKSGLGRVGVTKRYREKALAKTSWSKFIPSQLDRFHDAFAPYALAGWEEVGEKASKGWKTVSKIPGELAALFLFILALARAKRHRKDLLNNEDNKVIWFSFMLGGVVWLFLMKKLATFHTYTVEYYLGLLLFLSCFVTMPIKRSERRLFWINFSMFVLSLALNSLVEWRTSIEKNPFVYDFEKIRNYLVEGGVKSVRIDGGHREIIKGSPYASSFLLGPVALNRDRTSEFVISPKNTLNDGKIILKGERVNLFQIVEANDK